MPTHRPSLPQHARPRRRTFTAPLIVASQLVVVSAAAVLANFGWTSSYKPDHQRLRHHDRADTAPARRRRPGNHHQGGEPTGSAVAPVPTGRPADGLSAGVDAAGGNGDKSDGGRPDGEGNGGGGAGDLGGSSAAVPAVDVVAEQTATAHWFVAAALDGRLGDGHQQAAQTAVTVATEHGFVDDPTRVAEALEPVPWIMGRGLGARS